MAKRKTSRATIRKRKKAITDLCLIAFCFTVGTGILAFMILATIQVNGGVFN